MLTFNVLAIDEVLPGGITTYSPAQLNELLGTSDRHTIVVVAAPIASAPRIQVTLEHSNDGRNWLPRSSAEIPLTTMTYGTAVAGGHDGSIKMGAFVRLKVETSADTGALDVKVYVAGRQKGRLARFSPDDLEDAEREDTLSRRPLLPRLERTRAAARLSQGLVEDSELGDFEQDAALFASRPT